MKKFLKNTLKVIFKIKIRYYIAVSFVISSLAVTPVALTYAYRCRGYCAIGGEFLIIPLCLILAQITLEIAKEYDFYHNKRSCEQYENY